MTSMKNAILKSNSRIMKNPAATNINTFNCCQKPDCPMNNNCL